MAQTSKQITDSQMRHSLVNAMGGLTSAIENIHSDPKLAERLLKLSLEKFKTALQILDREANEKQQI